MEVFSPLQFIEAIRADDLDEVRYHLGGGPGRQNQRFQDNFRPLHFAALYGSPKVLELLLREGADVQALIEAPVSCGDGDSNVWYDYQCRLQYDGWSARDLAVDGNFPSLAARLEAAGCPARVKEPRPDWRNWLPARRRALEQAPR